MSKATIKGLVIIACILLGIFLLFGVFRIQDKILKIVYPKKYNEYVTQYANEYNVDENLVFAIIKSESNFQEEAVSNKEAKGLMQIMDSTAEDMASKENIILSEDDILLPEVNIKIGTKYIATLLEKYKDVGLALAAYNAGSGNVDKWIEEWTLESDGSNIENIPFKETNNYVRKTLRDYKIYEKLYVSNEK